jgi:FKBP-type peptidyl-prolyl cis-trans isomerase SlpA
MTDQINLNSLVLMHYSLAMTNGTVIESSFDDEPLQITMGSGQLTDGMELAIVGLEEEEEQTLTLTSEQCFGERDEANIHDMPLSDFTGELKPETGLTFNFGTDDGHEILGTVRTVKDNVVEVDFNHPLAGHSLIFSVKILGINNAHAQTEIDQ